MGDDPGLGGAVCVIAGGLREVSDCGPPGACTKHLQVTALEYLAPGLAWEAKNGPKGAQKWRRGTCSEDG